MFLQLTQKMTYVAGGANSVLGFYVRHYLGYWYIGVLL